MLPSHVKVATVAVIGPGKERVVINKADFDPENHTRWTGDEPVAPAPASRAAFDLDSLDLSARAKESLTAMGLTSAAAIFEKAQKDPAWERAVTGVGRASALRIEAHAAACLGMEV